MTDGSYLSARNVSNLLRQTAITGIGRGHGVRDYLRGNRSVGRLDDGAPRRRGGHFDVWLGWPLPLTVAVTLVLGLVLGPGTAGG